MLKQISSRVLAKRHFWRYASFTELNELYISNMLRAIAGSLFSVFVPIYMLKSGYSVTYISLYFVVYFVVRVFGDLLSGLITARIGPKHTWILSHICSIINLICLLGITSTPYLFWVSALFSGLSTSLLHVALFVDFSKIKHPEHSGKEQGYFMILEKVGSAVGPIMGGYIAAQYAPSFTIVASIVLFAASLIPLLSTPEAVQTRQKIQFKGFPYKRVWRDIVSHSAQGIDTTVTAGMWPLFMAIVIFSGGVYQSVGFATTISFVVSVFMTYIIGKIVDSNWSLKLLRLAVVLDSLTYVGRIFTRSLGGVLAVNVSNEAAYTGSMVAYNKGMFAAADDLPGYRIAYFTAMEMVSEFAKGMIWAALAVLSALVSDSSALVICFAATAVIALFIMSERFSALRPRVSKRLLQ